MKITFIGAGSIGSTRKLVAALVQPDIRSNGLKTRPCIKTKPAPGVRPCARKQWWPMVNPREGH